VATGIIGALSGFDRLVFRGTLRMVAHRGGMMTYLWAVQVLLKNFARHAEALTKELRDASEAAARRTGRPIRYLPSSVTNKEQIAREIAAADGITKGLICILTAVELCQTYELVRDRENKHLNLVPRRRKCLHLYHYYLHPVLGFMHARIQTWFPFSIQICVNGREWLARSMDAARMKYGRRDNCFTWLRDPERAQQLMDQQLATAWPELLDSIARDLNPMHDTMFQAYPMEYSWSAYQTEWATDIMFHDTESLDRLYPGLVHHGLMTFVSPDVMRFLGRNVPPAGNIPPRLLAELSSDVKRRPEGVRIKHRLGENSIKLYNKTINGFRNRDLRELLFDDADASPEDRRRHAAAVSRKLALLRMHRLIRKVTGTHRYHLTVQGRIVVTAMITARNTSAQALTTLAA
jgi:hypothetical protein